MRLARNASVPALVLAFGLALAATPALAQDAESPAPASSDAPAAPAPATPQAGSCLGKARLRGQTFVTESATIVPEAEAVLDLLATAIQKNCAGKKITIEGHCDVRGDEAYNQELSERRAEAVKVYLVSKGVPADQLSTVGYGESRPLSETDHALNRRVAFVVEGEAATAAP